MNHPNNSTGRLRLKPLAACLAVTLAMGAASQSTDAAPRRGSAVNNEPAALSERLRRTGDGFLRIQHEKLVNGYAKAREVAPRPAGAVPVTNCADDGSPGSLREVVANAVDGDTVDLSALTCSTITLVDGGIAVNVDNLNVVGPGATALTIDAAGGGTAFDLYGSEYGGYGTLSISGLTLTNGFFEDVGGGAIWTGNGGSVVLVDSVVTNSSSIGKYAGGGGIFSAGNVTLTNSTVSGCTADSSKYDGIGGGVYAAGDVTIVNSTVSGNLARSNGTYSYEGTYYFGVGIGGGVSAAGTLTISNSTISGNAASYGGGAAGSAIASLNNSTITLNSVSTDNSSGEFGAQGGGVVVLTPDTPTGTPRGTTAALNSSILFGNTGGGAAYGADFGGADVVITGANNLVGASTVALPAGTLSSNPLLGALAANGGPTQTHALGAGSPAVDAGNNVAGLTSDQRGGTFARVSGPAADIGAFEVQGGGGGPGPGPVEAIPVPATSTWALLLLGGLLALFGWRRGLGGIGRRS